MRGAFNQVCRNAGCLFAPSRSTGGQQRQQFVVAQGVVGDEVILKQSVPVQHVQQAECQGRIRSGERLEVEVGLFCGLRSDWIDHDLPGGGFGQPMLVGVRGGMGRVCAPDQNTARVRGSAGVKADI